MLLVYRWNQEEEEGLSCGGRPGRSYALSHFSMWSPDLRTFLAYPRQKLFEEDLSYIARATTASMRATPDKEGNEAVRLHRSSLGRVASWIQDFMKIKKKIKTKKR